MSCGGTCSQSNPPALRSGPVVSGWHLPQPSVWLGGWLVRLVERQRRWRRHEELRDLSDAQLRDVGLTREQIGNSVYPK